MNTESVTEHIIPKVDAFLDELKEFLSGRCAVVVQSALLTITVHLFAKNTVTPPLVLGVEYANRVNAASRCPCTEAPTCHVKPVLERLDYTLMEHIQERTPDA